MGLTPIVRKNCSCCKKLRDSSYYKNNDEICVPCCIFCNGKRVCQILEEELVELFYNYKKYFVKKSDIDNKRNKIVILPNGITFDLTQMYVDTTDKYGNKLECPRFRGSNSDYEIWGQLPVVGVIRAEGLEGAKKI